MPEHEYDDLLAGVRGATDAVSARPDAVTVVRGRVAVRRKRRRTTGVLAAVAAVVVIVGAGLLVDRSNDTDAEPAGPIDQTSAPPSAIEGDQYRPAGFFEDVVGGRAAPREIRYRLAKGEKFVAELDWWPSDGAGTPYLVGIGLERGEDRPANTVQRFEDPARDVYLDPLHRRGPLDAPPEAVVRGVTYLRADGWAVTVLVCSCSGDGSNGRGAPPLSHDQLEEVATSDSWVRAD